MDQELKKALDILGQVCADFKGNLSQHQNIQGALDKVKKTLRPPTDETIKDNKDA